MLDITTKRVSEVADLPVKNADGIAMFDDQQKPVTATVFGPGTKVWTVADAKRRRKAVKRMRENKGKSEAVIDAEGEDAIEFLCEITKRFNNLSYPDVQGDAETVRAVYSDPLLGFIRDHMEADTRSWENFMKASASGSASTSDNLPG